jgi:Tfp pilus assembly PilM family ATPase
LKKTELVLFNKLKEVRGMEKEFDAVIAEIKQEIESGEIEVVEAIEATVVVAEENTVPVNHDEAAWELVQEVHAELENVISLHVEEVVANDFQVCEESVVEVVA